MSRSAAAGKDFYRILQVSRTSTRQEIKEAYRKLALILHPDVHDGCEIKTQKFKDVTEAYGILSNDSKRSEYDVEYGHANIIRYNKNRRRPPPRNYRKVYRPAGPKMDFNHDYHYEMHYGDGMMDEALKDAQKEAQEHVYQSPLGKGFYFTDDEDIKTGPNNDGEAPRGNPYAKSSRGGGGGGAGRRMVLNYQEEMQFAGKQYMRRKNQVVYDLHKKRQERHYEQQATQDEQQIYNSQQYQQRKARAAHFAAGANNDNQEACIIS